MELTITEPQAEFILANYLKICDITATMSGDVPKTFAIDGRMLGDIGECVLAYAFDLKVNKKQNKGFDAMTKSGKKVEIKVRTNNKHIHISNSTIANAKKEGCYLLVAEINKSENKIKIVINGKIQPKVENERNNGFISRNKLKTFCTGRGLKLIHDTIGSWRIVTG